MYTVGMHQKLTKAGSNWVDGDRFFDREDEIEALRGRVQEGHHTLVTAQRRMGKTSLVRELLRRLDEEGEVATVFVDLEAAQDAADAIAEIAVQSKRIGSVWDRTQSIFANWLRDLGSRVDEVSVSELRVKLRASIDAGSWQLQGEQVFEALASHEKPVVLAIDELPILINRMLKGPDYRITPERQTATEQFLSWLRKNGQLHSQNVTIIVSGSIGLEPVLHQAGLSSQANIFAPFQLRPWSRETSIECLQALARNYDVQLSEDVAAAMCDRLRCCVPHHVQQFFDLVHQHLRSESRNTATLDDVAHVYERDLLSVRGQIDQEHYQERLRTMLGIDLYRLALELLTDAAARDRMLDEQSVALYREEWTGEQVQDVLYLLEHDGYLERYGQGYRFVSGLLEDWWRARYGYTYPQIAKQRLRGNSQ